MASQLWFALVVLRLWFCKCVFAIVEFAIMVFAIVVLQQWSCHFGFAIVVLQSWFCYCGFATVVFLLCLRAASFPGMGSRRELLEGKYGPASCVSL